MKYLITNQSIPPQLKLNYSYSLGGKLKQLGLSSGNVVKYDYSATGQLSGIRLNDQSYIQNIQYNANGIKGRTYSVLGDAIQFEYDLDGRIKRINMPNVFDKNYSFDSANHILSINDATQSLFNSSFKHDALSRLTRQTTQGTTTNTENYTIASDSSHLTGIQQGTNTSLINIYLQV